MLKGYFFIYETRNLLDIVTIVLNPFKGGPYIA